MCTRDVEIEEELRSDGFRCIATTKDLDKYVSGFGAGLCGWLAFCLAHKVTNAGWVETYALVSALAFGAAWASVVIGYRIARLEVTPRLFTLTFLLVAYDGETVKGGAPSSAL